MSSALLLQHMESFLTSWLSLFGGGREQGECLGWDERCGEGREGAKPGNYQKDIDGIFILRLEVNMVKLKGKSSFSVHTLHTNTDTHTHTQSLLHCHSPVALLRRGRWFFERHLIHLVEEEANGDEIRGISGKESVKHKGQKSESSGQMQSWETIWLNASQTFLGILVNFYIS